MTNTCKNRNAQRLGRGIPISWREVYFQNVNETQILNTYPQSHFSTNTTTPAPHCSASSPPLTCLAVPAVDSMVLISPTLITPDSHISRDTSSPTHTTHRMLHIYFSQSLEVQLCTAKLHHNGSTQGRDSLDEGR